MSEEQEEQSFEDAFNELADGDENVELQEEAEAEEEGLLEDQEPEPEPEPEPEQAPDVNAEVERLRQEAQQWQHRYNSDLGRQNALQRKIKELEQQNAKLQSTPQSKSAGMSDKEWKELQEDFPEVAKAVEAKLNSLSNHYESEITALKNNLTPIQQKMQVQAEEALKAQQYAILEQQHSDWRDVASSKEFQSWVQNQPKSIQALTDSVEAADAAFLIGSYKREQGLVEPQAQPELKQKRERQLRQAQTVPSRGNTRRSGQPPEDDFEAAFDYFADKDERRRR